ncbi:hypothetical protein J2X71_007549 [Rhizobium sp. 1399]|nr:hypothetical protein [Rhizobium sp. 1399]
MEATNSTLKPVSKAIKIRVRNPHLLVRKAGKTIHVALAVRMNSMERLVSKAARIVKALPEVPIARAAARAFLRGVKTPMILMQARSDARRVGVQKLRRRN